MISDLFVYFAVFALSMITVLIFQKLCLKYRVRVFSHESKSANNISYCLIGCVMLSPIIAMFGLRYGIGTDYFSYELIYNAVHSASFSKYWTLHNIGDGYFYIEPGYYILNKILPNYRSLLWVLGILIFVLFLIAVKDYYKKMSIPFALFIYLSTQYLYSLNAMRFAIALCFILIGYKALSQDKTSQFVIMILLASLFHTSSLFCFAMLFLKRFKYKSVSSTRNFLLFAAILSFPFLSNILLGMLQNISLFKRYFSTAIYSASDTMNDGWLWILHVVPAMVPLLLFCRKEMFGEDDSNTFFRICIMEIPFRMLGLYNTWYTRFARCAQIGQVILIPLVLSRVQNKNKKIFLYGYYVVWFIFYFGYYAIVNDQGDSLPYVWIFSH